MWRARCGTVKWMSRLSKGSIVFRVDGVQWCDEECGTEVREVEDGGAVVWHAGECIAAREPARLS